MTDTFANRNLAARLQPRTPGPGGAVNERERAMYEAGYKAAQAEERALAAEALKAAHEREERLLARLNNPDEAMAMAVAETAAASFRDGPRVDWKAAIRALAAELANEESNDK